VNCINDQWYIIHEKLGGSVGGRGGVIGHVVILLLVFAHIIILWRRLPVMSLSLPGGGDRWKWEVACPRVLDLSGCVGRSSRGWRGSTVDIGSDHSG